MQRLESLLAKLVVEVVVLVMHEETAPEDAVAWTFVASSFVAQKLSAMMAWKSHMLLEMWACCTSPMEMMRGWASCFAGWRRSLRKMRELVKNPFCLEILVTEVDSVVVLLSKMLAIVASLLPRMASREMEC